ncbi:MAG: cytidylate kinase family protein [Dysosmobacter sp.]
MKNRVITISREFGSGGRTIGRRVAEKLGIPCYDSELIQQVAEKSGFSENYIKDAGEYAPGGFLASALSHRAPAPTMRTISGRSNTISLPNWQKRDRA